MKKLAKCLLWILLIAGLGLIVATLERHRSDRVLLRQSPASTPEPEVTSPQKPSGAPKNSPPPPGGSETLQRDVQQEYYDSAPRRLPDAEELRRYEAPVRGAPGHDHLDSVGAAPGKEGGTPGRIDPEDPSKPQQPPNPGSEAGTAGEKPQR
jgi:hypothetical protein